MGINILLMVKEAEKTLEFYKNIGFREEMYIKKEGRKYYGEVSFQGKDNQYLLMFIEEEWWKFQDEINRDVQGNGVVIYIPVEDLDSIYENIKGKVNVVLPPAKLYYGKELVISDPDGYKIAFFQVYQEGEHMDNTMEIWRR